MGKSIKIVLVCVLLLSGMVYGYSAAGRVYDNTLPGIKTVVPNPTGTISYQATGGNPTNPIVGNPNGYYSGGWPSSYLVGKYMTVRAQDATGSARGSFSWTAQANTETGKDVLIYLSVVINPNLSLNLEPIGFVGPGPQPSAGATMQNSGAVPIPVQNYSATLSYDESKMMVGEVYPPPDSFFDVFTTIEPGRVIIEGHSLGPVFELLPGMSMGLFQIEWVVHPFVSRDSTVVDMTVELPTTPVPNQAIPHQTEYLFGPLEQSEPYFLLDSSEEWQMALDEGTVRPMRQEELEGYMKQWQDPEGWFEHEGEPYPPSTWLMPDELYVWPSDEQPGGNPNDAGLVMVWGETKPNGEYGSAFKYDYKLDPDYSNCTITVQVFAPQTSPAPPFAQINQVSLGLQNIPQVGGPVRAWYWNVGPAGPIQWNTPTTITVDTSKIGLNATNPPATGYVNNPGFNIKTVQWIIVDENGTWVGGPQNAPPPGGTIPGMWNYWHNLSVTPNPGGSSAVNSKWFVKYSQAPELLEPDANPLLINGWDEYCDYQNPPIWADDWECKDKRPVTDIHWWGSFIGWTQPNPPPVVPVAFHIGIWTDVPAHVDRPYSHPGQLIWRNRCTSYIWNFAGYDVDPFHRPERQNETCFQFAQFLSQDDWFHQELSADGRNIYWLSIAPIYNAQDYPPKFPWGWKTRPHVFQDDACSIMFVQSGTWPPVLYDVWQDGFELRGLDGESWDLAFELTTNQPAYEDNPIPGDITGPVGIPDGKVDLYDLVVIAANWLNTAP